MSDITVVGLGLMGAALARALQQAGHAITVWNRTPAKMQPFVAAGAQGASSLASAVRASPIVLVCVDNYSVTRRILGSDDVLPGLSGRTLIQLSTGTPREARDSEAWATNGGAAYIDGAILGGPASIGTPGALILFGGPQAAFERCAPLLRCLGGDLRYLGPNVAAAAALDLAWLCQRIGLFLGLAHGARLCESEKVGTDLYASMFPEGDRARMFAEVVHADAYGHPGATLNAWNAGLQRIGKHARDAGIDCEIPDFASRLFERAIAAGHGEEDVAALIKVLRAGPA